jgi:tRNA(Ile)-lysidine synthase
VRAPTPALPGKLRRALAALGGPDPHAVALVAVSGGLDSVALLVALREVAPDLPLAVGHVDHALRPGSADDARAVERLARELGVPFHARRLEWPDARPISEARARTARLQALASLADRVGARWILTAHTADDQLETLIMRLVRGAGPTGLAGIPPRRGRFLRPLLDVTRAEVAAYAAARGLVGQEDPTNLADGFLRNRMRHGVVPRLRAENPAVALAASRTAAAVRAEVEALDHYETIEWQRLAQPVPGGVAVDAAALGELPRGMAMRLVRRLWRAAAPPADAELGLDAVERVLALGAGRAGSAAVCLPGGQVALRAYRSLCLVPAHRLDDPGDVAVTVPGPGTYALPGLDTGVVITAGEGDGAAARFPLILRNARPGDRLALVHGHRKLSDWFVDRRVPRWERRRVPLLVHGDVILWLPGLRTAAGIGGPELRVEVLG